MAWVLPQNVKDRWIGSDELPAGDATVATLIADAEVIVRSEFPGIDDRIVPPADPDEVSGAIPKENVVMVVCRMIIRYLRNPDGARQRQETVGPFNQSQTVSADMAVGDLWLTDEDRSLLQGSAGVQKAFSIDLTPAAARCQTSDSWVINGPCASSA